jgi:hypothetical protein
MPLRRTSSYSCDLSVGELSAPKVRRSFQAVNIIVMRSIGQALNGPFCVDPARRRGFRDPQIGIHHPLFGKMLKEKMDPLKIPCEVVAAGKRLDGGTPIRPIDFLKEHFGLKK